MAANPNNIQTARLTGDSYNREILFSVPLRSPHPIELRHENILNKACYTYHATASDVKLEKIYAVMACIANK